MDDKMGMDGRKELDFPEEEYQDRYARAWALMRERGMDALLVTDIDNYVYFSGHTATYGSPHWMWSSHARPFAMILPLDRYPILVMHLLEKPPAQRAAPWCEVRTYFELPFQPTILVDVLKKAGLEAARIGAELGLEQRFFLPVNDLRSMERSLPRAEFVDASEIFLALRFIKSPREVERLRRSCEITVEAFMSVLPTLRPGVSEREIATRIAIRMLELGADRPAHFMLSRTVPEHQINRPSERPFNIGETLRIDLGAVYREYKNCMSVTIVCGPPTKRQQELFDIVVEILADLEGMIRPGIAMSEVIERCNSILADHGLPPKEAGRIGHGIGLNGNERPSLDLQDDTAMAPGMCLALEPGIYQAEGGFVVEDNFVVRDSGIELLHPDTLKTLYMVSK